MEDAIDVVIAWVDGDDPGHREKRERYMEAEGLDTTSAQTRSTRFSSSGEVRYCVLSIMRFAPFVRNIYLLTDGQDPKLEKDIERYFPARMDSFRIVDHREVFRGFEDCLPTFNSRSLEFMLWRIPGLSERFVYFNDDAFLLREISPGEWFQGNRPVIRGSWKPAPRLRLGWEGLKKQALRLVTRRKNYSPRASFHLGQWNAASLTGFRWRYFVTDHTAHVFLRSTMESFFREHPDKVRRNIAHRFRSPSQFTAIALFYHLQLREADPVVRKPGLVYMQPFGRGGGYIGQKLHACEAEEMFYLCVQSLDRCPVEEQQKVLGWLSGRLALSD